MRRAKPHTNTPAERSSDRDTKSDDRGRTLPEPAFCPGCGAVYVEGRWSHTPADKARAGGADTPVTVSICAACRRRRTGVPHGYVHVDGEFFPAHQGELEALLHTEVEHAREDNPHQQVLGWEHLEGGGLLITTSTDNLAQRLGRVLEEAYDGQVHYGFSDEYRLAHVWWHR